MCRCSNRFENLLSRAPMAAVCYPLSINKCTPGCQKGHRYKFYRKVSTSWGTRHWDFWLVLSDNCYNRVQNNAAFYQNVKSEQVGFEPMTTAQYIFAPTYHAS